MSDSSPQTGGRYRRKRAASLVVAISTQKIIQKLIRLASRTG
jgi:hypothetical protein